MNTIDIRDMEQGQWAYWASAIPVTIVVIMIGLWLTGELGNALTWLGIRNGNDNQSRGYALIPPYNGSSGGSHFSRSRMRGNAPATVQHAPAVQDVQEVFVDDGNYDGRSAGPPFLRHRPRQFRY